MFKTLLKTGFIVAALSYTSVLSAIQIKGQAEFNQYQSPIGSNGEVDDRIVELADKLLASNRINKDDMGNIAITSFVDLHNLSKTTSFGRALGETFFNELFIRGFNVADFRGQNALTINTTGEFFITRNAKLINRNIPNKYVLVGTYTSIDNKILINARIMDNKTGKIVASAKTYYNTNDCRLLNNCVKPRTIRIISNSMR